MRRSSVRVRIAVGCAIRVAILIAVRQPVRVPVQIVIRVSIPVRRLLFFFVRVGVALRRIVFLIRRTFGICIGVRRRRNLAFFRGPADVDRDRLAHLYDFAGVRKLNQDSVRFCLAGRTRSAHAKIETSIADRVLGRSPIFSDNVGHARLRAAERQIDCTHQPKRKRDSDSHDDRNSLDYR